MPDLPESGLRAVLEGVREFERDAKKVDQALENIEAYMDLVAENSQRTANVLEEAFGKIGSSAVDAKDDLESLTQITALQALQGVSTYAAQAGNALLDLGKDSAFTAARTEELYVVLDNMAEQAGLSATALREQVAAVKEQGIQTSVASNLVSQFVRSELDLSKATELARVAQDAAVISMEDSSQALAGLLHGILTLQPEVLRYRGIIVDLQGEYQKWSAETGRTVQSMTGAEKQAVALNAVLEQGQSIAGTYTAAMGSASKQIRSFPRYVAELQEVMGQALLPAMEGIVFTAADLVKGVKDLPPPILQTIAVTGTLTGALLKGGSQAVAFAAQVGQIATALKAVATAEQIAALGVLGPAGLLAAFAAIAGVGVVTYLNAQEEAHQREATAALTSAETYEIYIGKLDEAGLGAYGLTEALYELVKAQDASAQAAYAEALSQTFRNLQEFDTEAERSPGLIAQIKNAANASSSALSDFELTVLADRESVLLLGTAWGKSGEELHNWATELVASAQATILARAETENYNEFERERYKVLRDVSGAMRDQQTLWPTSIESVAAYNAGIEATARSLEDMLRAALDTDPAVVKLTESFEKLIEKEGQEAALAASMEMVADAIRARDEAITKAEEDASEARQDAVEDFTKSSEGLWEDYGDAVADVQDDIADAHQDLMESLADAEKKAAKERAEIEEDLADTIAQLQADLAADLEQAARDLSEDLASIDQEYAEKRQQLQEDLNESLAELEEDLTEARADAAENLQDALTDIEESRQKNVEKLEEAHQKKLEELAEARAEAALEIEEAYQKERQRILDAYAGIEERDLEQERRDLLKRRKELEAILAAPITTAQEQKQQRAAKEELAALQEQLEKLKDEELANLDERRDQALTELEERAAEEQAKLDEAHQEALAENDKRAEELRQQRLEDYEEQLADLEEAAQEQRQELQEAYQERLADLNEQQAKEKAARQAAYEAELADLRAKNEAEKEEAARRAAESLAALDERLAEEKARLQEQYQEDLERLNQRLADEKASYAERLAELKSQYDERLMTINEKEEEQKEAATKKAEETVENVTTAWEGLDPALSSVLEGVLRDAILPEMETWQTEMVRKATEISDAVKAAMEDAFEVQSPSKWATRLVGNIAAGALLGMGQLEGAMGQVVTAVSAPTVSAPALPAPSGTSGAGTTSNTRNYNLNYTGSPQSEPSLRSQFTMMEIISGG